MKWFKRDWTEIRPNTMLGRVLRVPLHLLPKRKPMKILSGPCRGMKWTLESNLYSFWFGTFEFKKQAALSKYVHKGMTIYDIGANAGFYTLLFSKLVGNKGHVYSFEPFPENSARLLRHIGLNDLTNITVINAAIGAADKLGSFQIAANNFSGHLSSNNHGLLVVPTLSIDALIEKGYPSPDIIKMDIEGDEVLALEGARNTLLEGKAIWFIALHNDEARKVCDEALKKARYQMFLLDGTCLDDISGGIDEIYALPSDSMPRETEKNGMMPVQRSI